MSQVLPTVEVNVAEATQTCPSSERSPFAVRNAAATLDRSLEVLREEPAWSGLLPDPALDVSVVVPYYNPGLRLRDTVDHLMSVLNDSRMTFEIIAVSDGSTDGSPLTLEGLPQQVVRRISYPTNAGKGHALRTGFRVARGRYVGFIDADGDISPEFLTSFLSIMKTEKPDFVIGTKRHPGAVTHNTRLRRLYSLGCQSLTHLLFRLDVRDTQVGIKIIDRRVMVELLPLLRENRFALDLELLVAARSRGYTQIVEAPIRIEERGASTISVEAVIRLLIDTMTVFWRSSVRHEYGRASTAGLEFNRPPMAHPLNPGRIRRWPAAGRCPRFAFEGAAPDFASLLPPASTSLKCAAIARANCHREFADLLRSFVSDAMNAEPLMGFV